MRSSKRMPARSVTTLCSMLLGSAIISACGGGNGGPAAVDVSGIGGTGIGVGGTGIVAGKITGFGSVFVNRDRFDTRNSRFVVDGEILDQSALALGMVIRVEAETEGGVFTGAALEVVYDDDVQGPIAAVPGITANADGTQKFFEVFGQKITIDDTATRFVGTGFNFTSIGVDDVVEISGFRVPPDRVVATYVEKTGDLVFGTSEVELRGRIDDYQAGPPETFKLGGILIQVDRGDPDLEIEVPGGILRDDLSVEVEGIIENATTIRAQKIEFEDESLGEDVDDVRLQGIVSNYVDPSSFKIAGQRIDASGAEIEPRGASFGNGVEVEVEGDIVGGVLFADELEIEDEQPELRSFVSSVDVGNNRFRVDYPFTVGASTEVVVRVNAQTLFEDDTGAIVTPPFSLDDLVGGVGRSGDFVRVEGQEVGGEVVASIVKRVDPDDQRKLEGAVDAYTRDVSITVLGITFQLDANTDYEPDPPDIEVGDFVEIEDQDELPADPADGVADEVEEE